MGKHMRNLMRREIKYGWMTRDMKLRRMAKDMLVGMIKLEKESKPSMILKKKMNSILKAHCLEPMLRKRLINIDISLKKKQINRPN